MHARCVCYLKAQTAIRPDRFRITRHSGGRWRLRHAARDEKRLHVSHFARNEARNDGLPRTERNVIVSDCWWVSTSIIRLQIDAKVVQLT